MSVAETKVVRGLIDRLQHRILEFSVPKDNRVFIRLGREDLKEVVKFLVNESFMYLSAITTLNIGDSLETLYHLSGNNILVTLRVTLPPPLKL